MQTPAHAASQALFLYTIRNLPRFVTFPRCGTSGLCQRLPYVGLFCQILWIPCWVFRGFDKIQFQLSTFPAHPQKNTHYLQPSLYLSVKTPKKLWVKATCFFPENSKSQVPATVWHCVHKVQAVWARNFYYFMVLSPTETNTALTCAWALNGFPRSSQ